jgi:hypothetical protein
LAVLAHFKLLHQTEPAQAAARDDRSQLWAWVTLWKTFHWWWVAVS